MKTLHPLRPLLRNLAFASIATLLPVTAVQAAPSQAPHLSSEDHARLSSLSGMYKVMSATDPLFPSPNGEEYFLDFGKGVSAGKYSGTVAVSMRQNPNVRVRILVWQLSPEEGILRIGNQTAQGSTQAVLRAEWRLGRSSSGLVLQRGDFHATLRPAGPND